MKSNVQLIKADAAYLPLADCCIDLTVTSPPYDNLRNYEGFNFDFEASAKELYRVTKQNSAVVWIVGDSTINGNETGTSFRQALFFKEIGFNLHDTMIYHKQARFPETNRYYQSFEYMFVFVKGKLATFNPITKRNKSFGRLVSGTERRANGAMVKQPCYGNEIKEFGIKENIWHYESANNGTKDTFAFQHPATFPEQLAADHIKSWSNEGDTVLDCFTGSGTTGKMAAILKRNFIGIEISSKYLEIAKTRIKRAQGIPCDLPVREVDKHLPLFEPQNI